MERRTSPPFVQQTKEKHPDKTVEVWLQDEARFGQKGTLTAIWAKRGTRPVAVRQTRYQNVYLFGAACAQTGQSHALLLPRANTAAMNLFLRTMAEEIEPARHVVLVLDQAGWHTSNDLLVPSCISLLFLPPYSPELNPMENLWEFLRRRRLSNRPFEDEKELLDAGSRAWCSLTPERIRSICHRRWVDCL